MQEGTLPQERTHVIEEFDTSELRNGDVASVTLTAADRSILSAMEPVVDAIATLFGEHCEVLIHSLEDLSESIVKISNSSVTGRQIGAPMTDLGIRVLKNAENSVSDVVGSYYGKTNDGKTLKSVTALIRNGTKPIGMLCINMSLSAPLMDIMQHLLPESVPDGLQDESPEHFVMSTEELVRRSLDTAIAETGSMREISHQIKNKLIVSELNEQGIFDVKGAVDIVAKELGVSRYTIYNYIREARV